MFHSHNYLSLVINLESKASAFFFPPPRNCCLLPGFVVHHFPSLFLLPQSNQFCTALKSCCVVWFFFCFVFLFSDGGINQHSKSAWEMCLRLMLPTPTGCLCPAYIPAPWEGDSIEAFCIRAVMILDFPGSYSIWVQAGIISASSRFWQGTGMAYADPADLPLQQESLRGVFHWGPRPLLVRSRCSPCRTRISLKGWHR